MRIFFTEHGHPRVAALGGGAEDEEGAERFRGAGSPDRFTLEVAEVAMPAARIAEDLAQHPAHIAAYFDPSTAKAHRFPRAPSLTVHPLCLPMQFSFDRITKAVRVVPAADGGIFSEHNDLRNRLSNIVTGSFYGVTAELQTEARVLRQLAAGCAWLIIGDRAQEGALAFDVPRVALHRCGKRDLAVYARGLARFVSEMDGQLRRCNYTPTRVAVERLIADMNLLLGDGLLSLIACGTGGAAAVDERRTRGLLGTLVASSWFRREHARSLVVSIDSPEARRWLELRDSGTDSRAAFIRPAYRFMPIIAASLRRARF